MSKVSHLHTHIRKSLVTILILNIVLTVFVFGVNTSSAAELPLDTHSDTQQCLTSDKLEVVEVDQETTNTLLNIVLESEKFRSFNRTLERENEEAKRQENILELKTEERYAYKVGDILILYIPITGGAGHSFYGIQFDESFSVVGSMAGLFRLNAQENVSFHYQINDQTIANLEITQEGKVVGGQVFDLAENEQELTKQDIIITPDGIGEWWDCMGSCLSWAGVPLYLIAGLSIVCGAACVITAGLACGACIAAALGAWSGVGAFCLAECADDQW
ncbi:MAG: hypothetical protein P8183_13220 [Anaerolineae bacterium]